MVPVCGSFSREGWVGYFNSYTGARARLERGTWFSSTDMKRGLTKTMYSVEESQEKRKTTKLSVLTEEQKKAHHIELEKRRRLRIRLEFDKLVLLTPTLSELENRLELNILTKSADYICALKLENHQLIEMCRSKGIPVPQELLYNGPTSDGSDAVTNDEWK